MESNTLSRFEWEKHVLSQKFNGEALRVLWAYASYADAQTLITFPTIRQVAEDTNISVEKVGRYRTALLDTGWLLESAEKTSRGNAKLMLGIGEVISSGYLGEKRKVNNKSMANLIPAAKQKKAAQSLDYPDEAGLENAENTGLENADIEALDYPDVTTNELNNQYRTTNNNQVELEVKEMGMKLDAWSCLISNDEVPVLESGITYFLSSEGVTKMQFKEGTFPTIANVVGLKTSFLPAEETGSEDMSNEEWIPTHRPKKVHKQSRLRDKSVAVVKQVVQQNREDNNERLDYLIRKNRLTEAQGQQARDWIADTAWEPQRKPSQRVAFAVLQASLIMDAS